jgi:hypothetical protein
LVGTLIFSAGAHAKEINGYTDDGRRIILNTDFSWKYSEPLETPQNSISYSDDTVTVTVVSASITKTRYRSDESNTITNIINMAKVIGNGDTFNITVNVKSNLTQSYLKFNTHRTSCDDITGECFRYLSGYVLKDNFGNNLKISGIAPLHSFNSGDVLVPEEEKQFKFYVKNIPFKSVSYVTLSVSRSINGFGNLEPFNLKIPVSFFTTDLVGNDH